MHKRCPGDILYADRLLARSWVAGTPNQPLLVRSRIYTPSSRLSCSLAISFEPDTPRVIDNYNNADEPADSFVEFSAYHRDSTGKLAKSYTTAAFDLPHARELDTHYPIFEIDSYLAVPGGVLKLLGNWILTVEWEPNVCIPPDELCELFAACDVDVMDMGENSNGPEGGRFHVLRHAGV